MCQSQREAARLALATRLRSPFRPLTEEELPQPEGEPLLPDTTWTMQQHARRQQLPRYRPAQSLAELLMTEEWE